MGRFLDYKEMGRFTIIYLLIVLLITKAIAFWLVEFILLLGYYIVSIGKATYHKTKI